MELGAARDRHLVAGEKGEGEWLALLGNDRFVIESKLDRSTQRSEPAGHGGNDSMVTSAP
jgi:hypothetical protein